ERFSSTGILEPGRLPTRAVRTLFRPCAPYLGVCAPYSGTAHPIPAAPSHPDQTVRGRSRKKRWCLTYIAAHPSLFYASGSLLAPPHLFFGRAAPWTPSRPSAARPPTVPTPATAAKGPSASPSATAPPDSGATSPVGPASTASANARARPCST